ncbi:YlcI/YnfO family protein [Hydrogenophaga sp.]|uniref:YlcI/YnfO family protein n=1 Tax=Hydrogenophaga sp. TaxID=1904254 RepID=UPI00272931EF|nr:YlcI/YnfO family protein [Hydrogenophaga sp.]MDO9133769.1 YlcI/YnfO family protein [Hydrogenophaga sp.]MDO9604069.1 YlcI/YnfO family protein [Hydrogenophaga sp.]
MKTATFPSLRVDPQLRDAAQSVLQEGETLSGFIEASVRETIERRRARAEFVARGLASREEALASGGYFAAGEVHAELGQMLTQARARLQKRAQG